MQIDFDPTNSLMPVFPLPNVVFFPETILPLYIFEQRYIEMTRDILRGNRIMAMALLKEGWKNNYNGSAEIYSKGTMGKIIEYQSLPKGRFNIILYGIAKIILEEKESEKPYRLVQTSTIKEPYTEVKQFEEKVGTIRRNYAGLLKAVMVPMYHEIMSQPDIEPLQFLNNLTAGLKIDIYTKQQLLSNTPMERIDKIGSILKDIAVSNGKSVHIEKNPGVSLN